MRSFYLFFLLGITVVSCGQKVSAPPTSILYSKKVKDSFEIYINAPQTIESSKQYSAFYYMDANLKSGKKLRELIAKPEFSGKVNNTIFVGIGHIGNFHVLRRRDFILPEITNNDTSGASANYGQIENFHQFLKTELMPMVDSMYKINSAGNSILGHSLAGLFAFYCLFKNDTVFKNYYALSPSLWVDDYSIYKFNQLAEKSPGKKYLYFSSGGLEIFNRIKAGTNEMDLFLKKQNYAGITYKYEIHSRRTHNSQVEHSLDFILRQN